MDEERMHPSELLEFKTGNANYLITTRSTDEQSASGKHVPFQHLKGTAGFSGPLHVDQATLDASKVEHRMTFGESLRLHPRAICWSALISMAILMEGYDTALISSFLTFDEFREKYGVLTESGYQITIKWQASLSNASVCGSIIGLFANGKLTERFGHRKTMIGALIMLAACIFFPFFAVNVEMLLVGQITCGISWGIFSTLTTTYAAKLYL